MKDKAALNTLIVSLPDLITYLPANRFSNKLALTIPKNILRNLFLCSFTSVLIVYFKDLIIFMKSSIYSSKLPMLLSLIQELFYEYLHLLLMPLLLVLTLLNYFKCIFINGNPVFSNGSRSLLINPHDCIILDNQVCNLFILIDELFAKTIQRFEKCLPVNNNLCWKLVSSLELQIMLEESFRVTSVAIFLLIFNLLSCELDNF